MLTCLANVSTCFPPVDLQCEPNLEGSLPRKAQTPAEHAQVRARILRIAREVYDAEGYSAVTVRNIARRCGYSPAALYRYFDSHLDLIRGVWQDAVDRMRDNTEAAYARQDDPLERVIGILRAYAQFAAREPAAFRSTFLQSQIPGGDSEQVRREGPLPELNVREGTSYRLLREAITEAIEAGRMIPLDPDLASQTFWGAIHGVIALRFNFPRFSLHDADERLEAALEMIVRGMGVPQAHLARDEDAETSIQAPN